MEETGKTEEQQQGVGCMKYADTLAYLEGILDANGGNVDMSNTKEARRNMSKAMYGLWDIISQTFNMKRVDVTTFGRLPMVSEKISNIRALVEEMVAETDGEVGGMEALRKIRASMEMNQNMVSVFSAYPTAIAKAIVNHDFFHENKEFQRFYWSLVLNRGYIQENQNGEVYLMAKTILNSFYGYGYGYNYVGFDLDLAIKDYVDAISKVSDMLEIMDTDRFVVKEGKVSDFIGHMIDCGYRAKGQPKGVPEGLY